MHEMKKIMEKLEGYACAELAKSEEQVDTKELGMVIDMVKDCAETMYYYSIAEEMKKRKEEEQMYEKMDKADRMYYRGQPRDSQGRFESSSSRRSYQMYMPEMYWPYDAYRDMDRTNHARMYYSGGNGGNQSSSNGMNGSNSNGDGNDSNRAYTEGYQRGYNEGNRNGSQNNQRDYREGRSGMSRRTYMDSKHSDNKQKKMNDLETYMVELSSDISEMIADASAEERDILKQKLLTLQQKIN